ncbi:MAG: integrin alpha [Deltaproteobacteria bacterium]
MSRRRELGSNVMKDNQTPRLPATLVTALLAGALLLPATAGDAGKRKPSCPIAGDALGESIAFGGDFDGDGIADIAAGSPCAMVRKLLRGGRVAVFSGATGLKIFGAKGVQEGQFMGASLSFADDIDGDGRAELVVGSPGYNVLATDRPGDLATGKKFRDGGRVDLLSCSDTGSGGCTSDPVPMATWFGETDQAMLGKAVAATSGGIASSAADIVAGAPGDRVSRGNGKRGQRKGRVHFYSGSGLDLPDPYVSVDGPKKGSRFGNVVVVVDSIDTDLIDDIAVGAEEANIGAKRTGMVRALSGSAPQDKIFDDSGAKKDRMGTSVAAAGDYDLDGRADLIVGSATADDSGLKNAGTVTVLSANGQALMVAADGDDDRQTGALFGSAVARIGDIDDDGIDDYAVGAPGQDTRARGQTLIDAGRVVAISGFDGQVLWSLDGTRPGMKLGHRVLAGPESGKGYARVLVGAPGDAPRGRRGAGTVRMLAGNSKQIIETFRGQRGLETRIFTFGYDRNSVPLAKTFGLKARPGELYAEVGGSSFGDLSVAVLDDSRNADSYAKVKIILGAGSNAGADGRVVIMDARSRNKAIASFKAFTNVEVNVGAGRIDSSPLHPTRYEEKIVAVEAYSGTGTVRARTFARVNPRKADQWSAEREFTVFANTDTSVQAYGATYGVSQMQARGATVAVGNVLGDEHEEIIVGSVEGVARVRVFSYTGAQQAEFVAYVPDSDGNGIVDTKGVRVAVGNVGGNNYDMIVTAPMTGAPLIRVFDGYGDRMQVSGATDYVEIDARCDEGTSARESGYCGGFCDSGGAFSTNTPCISDAECAAGSTCELPGTCATSGGVTESTADPCFDDKHCGGTQTCQGKAELFSSVKVCIGGEDAGKECTDANQCTNSTVCANAYCETDAQCSKRGLGSCYLGPTCLASDYTKGGHVATANLDFDRRQEIIFMPGARTGESPPLMAFDAATGTTVVDFREHHPFPRLTGAGAALTATDGYAR